jgi:hypothetical protein
MDRFAGLRAAPAVALQSRRAGVGPPRLVIAQPQGGRRVTSFGNLLQAPDVFSPRGMDASCLPEPGRTVGLILLPLLSQMPVSGITW